MPGWKWDLQRWSDTDLLVRPTAPDDDASSYWPAVGGIAISDALTRAAMQAQSAAVLSLSMAAQDEGSSPRLTVEDEYDTARRFTIVYGDQIPIFHLSDETNPPPGPAQIHFYDDWEVSPNGAILTPEPTIFMIHPGNWAAGNDERPRPIPEEFYYQDLHPAWPPFIGSPWSLPQDFRRFVPWPDQDDPRVASFIIDEPNYQPPLGP